MNNPRKPAVNEQIKPGKPVASEYRDPRGRDPYAEGADAANAGRSDTSNPYRPATDAHLSWNDGYRTVKRG